MPVLVVESPAKAKTIGKYLGKDYTVLATNGHIRNLVRKDGSVDPDDQFRMTWEILPEKRRQIEEIAKACKKSDTLILATDRDREGEAIGWHLTEVLAGKRGRVLPETVFRITFDAITRKAVEEGLENRGAINRDLVEAYLTRSALDYLVGFGISPILWRRFPVGKSAGRVQSACLRLIAERETEIEKFVEREYWSIKAELVKTDGKEGAFTATLSVLDGRKLGKFALATEKDALSAKARVMETDLAVTSVKSSPVSQSPPPPFITATMQQVAIRALGFSAKQTMSAAQKLYEDGLITYMRTDSVSMSPEGYSEVRALICSRFGNAYALDRQRTYKGKVRNAQEAHECIRPSSFRQHPRDVKNRPTDQRRLYDLIWKRAVASQMKNATFRKTAITIASPDEAIELTASGQTRTFDGYQKLLDSESDESRKDQSEATQALAELAEGDALDKKGVTAHQHFTKPPARYTEASIVKEMVELGIGRPSTYASVLSTIQERGYVEMFKRTLKPTSSGRLAIVFLARFFERYIELEYTAALEEDLDTVSRGQADRLDVLRDFWSEFSVSLQAVWELKPSEVREHVTAAALPLLLPADAPAVPNGSLTCPECGQGQLVLKFSRNGGGDPFLGCTRYPECTHIHNIAKRAERVIGTAGHPANTPNIVLKDGRYGPYIESGDQRISLPKDIRPDDLTEDLALQLLSLPRTITEKTPDAEPILARLGRYGPYITQGKTNANLPSTRDLFTIDDAAARKLLAQRTQPRSVIREITDGTDTLRIMRGRYGPYIACKGQNIKIPNEVTVESLSDDAAWKLVMDHAAKTAASTLGQHPKGGDIQLLDGRYGPYVKWKRINASLPADTDPASLSLAAAIELINAKAGSGRRRKAR
ncbi:MAG: type I DNA topoisomerase [Rhodobacteraceae bacterium]|nr:type I DNA topoisomerase [Paracoccaceae bacterium]